MDYFIDDVLIASFFSVEFGRVVSTGFSVALLAVNLLLRVLNRKNHPPAALYHFTTYGRMMSILGTGCVRGGHHGIVFTTANKKYRNRGSVRYRKHTQTHEHDNRARIIFKAKSVELFQSCSSRLLSVFTGTSLYAELSDEFTSRRKGNIKLLKYRRRGTTLVVTDAAIIAAPTMERLYMSICGFLLSVPKTLATVLYIFTILFWVDYFFSLTWFRLYWLPAFLIYAFCFPVSACFAKGIYLLFRHRIQLP